AQIDFQVLIVGEIWFLKLKTHQFNDENFGWDGTFKNEKVSGNFVWVATVKFEDGTEEVLKGSVLLIR
ncbi:MAG: hypothetical protein HC803_06280, partial [Saprospiraceae bacterium]|nr:hypothetical protein [Saprospiraceae bacterium]